MRISKAAVYLRVTSDPTLMNLLGQVPPYPGRLPLDAPQSRTVGAITFEGDTSLARGSKEDQTMTLHLWAFSHDVTEDIASNLDRLFRPSPGRQWVSLSVASGRAFIRREFAADVPDSRSELWHRIYRLRIKFAWAAAS